MSSFPITAFECAVSKVTDALHEATAAVRCLPLSPQERQDVREVLRDLRYQVACVQLTTRALLGDHAAEN